MSLYISNGLYYINKGGIWLVWNGLRWVRSRDAKAGYNKNLHNRWLSDLKLVGNNYNKK